MKKLVVLFFMLIINMNLLAFYDFDVMHDRINKIFSGINNLNEQDSVFIADRSMHYFDEKNNKYIVKIHTTISKKNLDVSVDDNTITINGNETTDDVTQKFSKSITLPRNTDIANITAQYNEQILTIIAPISKKASTARTIKIN